MVDRDDALEEPSGAERRRTHLLVAVMVAGAAWLRFAWIGQESYWYDELCSVLQTQGSLAALIRDLVHADVHPPLYFVLLWAWERVFGSGEVATRAFSAVCGALLGILVAVPVLVPVAISLVSQPIFHPKYAISILGPVALWNARALLSLRRALARRALIAGVLAMWVVALPLRVYAVVNKEQWREIADDARALVVAEAETARFLRWYLRDVPVRALAGARDVDAVEDEARRAGVDILYVAVHPEHTEREPLLGRRWARVGEVRRYAARAVRYRVGSRPP